MASLKSDEGSQMKTYKFQDGMILQCDVYMFSNGHKAKVKFQLQNCSETWILHWGCISNGNKKWFVPSCYPSRTTVYMKTALCTPFIKYGDKYVVDIELQDPKIHAIEFVLKDTRHDKWLKKKNGASFCIKLHKENDVKIDGAGIAKDLVTETSRKNNTLRNMYVMSLEETCDEMVGEKSRNIRFLNKKIPTWIKFPASIVLPFGVFEKALSEDLNKEVAKKIAWLGEHVDGGDISKLKMVQETVMQMKAPHRMRMEVRKKMKSSRIPWPSGPPEDTWNRIWQAIKMVWASKWNEEAYRKTNITYDKSNKLKIGILVQEYIRADYAFVTYTYHPVSQDSSYIYTEIVKGSIETLVGVSLGRPMTCITKKSDLKSPIVTCYPSKSTGLYTRNKRSMIFRADFISDNTNNIYTSNGIYDSISMEKNEEVVLDYSRDRLVTDLRFQGLILSKIAEVAKNIEDMYGCAHNIEGVVQDEQVYILQCKPLL